MNKRIPIYFISPEEATKIVEIWETRPNMNKHLYIAEEDKWFIVIDNTTGEPHPFKPGYRIVIDNETYYKIKEKYTGEPK